MNCDQKYSMMSVLSYITVFLGKMLDINLAESVL